MSKSSPIYAVKGMSDILPASSARWEWVEDKVRQLMLRYGYANIRTPIVESTALFIRGLGEVTDIVEKEMYSFTDALNGDQLSLRPENTAGVVRATIEHSLLYQGGQRLYYMGSMFRHERPQKGRYRQFHQIGAEALGFSGPDVDAELILMSRALWQELGLKIGTDITLQLNSLGQTPERLAHRNALIAYLQRHQDQLDEDSVRRLQTNPLRILDSKNPAMQELINQAPQLLEFLEERSLKHFDAVRAILSQAGLTYVINPRLVRGMDYYNLTVFEWVTERLGAQGTVCGGGRYDTLIEQLGGKPAPAVGWGLGLERLLLLLEEVASLPSAPSPLAYAIVPNPGAIPLVMQILEDLRKKDISIIMHPLGTEGSASMKAQFKRADASGAKWALIFGEAELNQGCFAVKPLRNPGEQILYALDDLAGCVQYLLA